MRREDEEYLAGWTRGANTLSTYPEGVWRAYIRMMVTDKYLGDSYFAGCVDARLAAFGL